MDGVDQSFWYSVSSENIKDGRHVGLDFYDLLIEALITHLTGFLTQVAAFSVNDRGVRIGNRRGAHRQRKLSANAVLVPFSRSNHRARAKRRNHWQFVAKPATLQTSELRGSP